MLEELSEAVLPERRSAVLRELERLDRSVALRWGEHRRRRSRVALGSAGHRRPVGHDRSELTSARRPRSRAHRGRGALTRIRVPRLDARSCAVPLAPAPRAADGRRRDRARDPHRAGRPRARRSRRVHRIPLGLRPRTAVLLRGAGGDRAPRPTRCATPRDGRLGHVARDRARVRRGARPDGRGRVWWLSAVALATTALGTLVPILSDARLLPTELGRAVLGTGVAGEFWPIIFISVFLTGVYGAATEIVLLIVFALVVAAPPQSRVARVRHGSCGSCGTRCTPRDRSAFARRCCPRAARLPRRRRRVRVRARGVRGGCPRRARSRLARREDRASSPRGNRLRLPRAGLLRRHRHELRPRQPPHGRGVALAAVFLALLLVTRGASALLWLRELGRGGP